MNAAFSVNRGVTLLMIIREMETFDFPGSLRDAFAEFVSRFRAIFQARRFYRAKWFFQWGKYSGISCLVRDFDTRRIYTFFGNFFSALQLSFSSVSVINSYRIVEIF